MRVSRGETLGGEASEDECPGLGESEDESEDDSGGVGSEDDDADPLVAGSGKKRVRGVNSSGKKITNKTGKTAAEMANESKGGGGVPTLGDGFVHYASHVYCQSNQRPESKHFDLTFQLFDLTGTYYQFKNWYVLHFPNPGRLFDHTRLTLFWQNSSDQTGKYAPGKDVSLLRSKVAVARYLERDGLSTEDIEQQEAALKQAKDKAEEKLVLRKAAELAAEELVADEIENVPVVLGDSPVAETATAAVSRVVAPLPAGPPPGAAPPPASVIRFAQLIGGPAAAVPLRLSSAPTASLEHGQSAVGAEAGDVEEHAHYFHFFLASA